MIAVGQRKAKMAFAGMVALIIFWAGHTEATWSFKSTPGPVVYYTPPEKVELRWEVPSDYPIFRIEFNKFFPQYGVFNNFIVTIPRFNYLWISIHRDRLDFQQQMTFRFNTTTATDAERYQCKVSLDNGVTITSETVLRIRPSSMLLMPMVTSSWLNVWTTSALRNASRLANQSVTQAFEASSALILTTALTNQIALNTSDISTTILSTTILTSPNDTATPEASAILGPVTSFEPLYLKTTSTSLALLDGLSSTSSFGASISSIAPVSTSTSNDGHSKNSIESVGAVEPMLTSSYLVPEPQSSTVSTSQLAPLSTAPSVIRAHFMSTTKFEMAFSSTYSSKVVAETDEMTSLTTIWKVSKPTLSTWRKEGESSSYKQRNPQSTIHSTRLLPTATVDGKKSKNDQQLSDKEIGLSVGLPVAFLFALGLAVWVFFMKAKTCSSRVIPKSQVEKNELEAIVALKYMPKD